MRRTPIDIEKESIAEKLSKDDASAFRKYQDFFLGTRSVTFFLKYEIITFFLSPLPGALGIFLRKQFVPSLLKKSGSGVLWGKNIGLRHPGKIEIGNRVAIDDECLIDAKGAGDEGVVIGDDVIIARGTVIQGKTSWVSIGNNCVIGNLCTFTSAGGIQIGNYVGIAGHCYIGGARYWYDERETPILEQGAYSRGPVVIEDDVWLGAGVIVADGVRIGKGAVIGAGSIVMEDVEEYSVSMPQHRFFRLPRG